MNPIIFRVFRFIIGKNSAHIARKVQTYIGGLLLFSVGLEIDPGILTGEHDYGLSEEEIKDGLTVGEVVRAVLGIVLWWGSRIMSFLRARNLDWAAEWAGIILGRSIHSFGRSILTLASAGLTYVGLNGGTEGGLTSTPLVAVIGAVLMLLLNGASSFLQDGALNPVEGSPSKNNVFG